MTAPDSNDLLELAEDVAAGRMTAADAELAVTSRGGDPAVVLELRQLVAAASAVRLHAAAFHEYVGLGDTSTGAMADSDGDQLAVAAPTVRRGSTIARRSTDRRRSGLLIAATLAVAGGTIMTDDWEHVAPFGPIGRLVDRLLLGRYMRHLLETRNVALKAEAERVASDGGTQRS